jgi:hypothetical protein
MIATTGKYVANLIEPLILQVILLFAAHSVNRPLPLTRHLQSNAPRPSFFAKLADSRT